MMDAARGPRRGAGRYYGNNSGAVRYRKKVTGNARTGTATTTAGGNTNKEGADDDVGDVGVMMKGTEEVVVVEESVEHVEERRRREARDLWRRKEREMNLEVRGRVLGVGLGDVGRDMDVDIGGDMVGGDGHGVGLDSSFKKCNAFIRKLRVGVSGDNVDALIVECEGLNLGKYVSEMVAGILEGRLKSSEVDAVVKLSGLLHRRYVDFRDMLVRGLMKGVVGDGGGALGVRKACLRILGELVVVGVVDDVSVILSTVKKLISSGKRMEEKNDVVNDVSVVGSWFKSASTAFLPSSDTGWETEIVKDDDKKTLSKWIESWYENTVLPCTEKCYQEFREAEAANVHAKQTKGIVGDDLLAEYERVRKVYERIEAATISIAEVFGKEFEQQKITSDEDASQAVNDEEELGEVWDDEEEERFYTTLPILPGSKQEKEALRVAKEKEAKERDNATPGPSEATGDSKIQSQTESVKEAKARMGKRATVYRKKKSASASVEKESAAKPGRSISTAKKEGKSNLPDAQSQTPRLRVTPELYTPLPSLDVLLSRLGSTDTPQSCDRFAATFCMVARSNRSAQKRLIKSLYTVSPLKVAILPFYVRIAASLFPLHPEVAQILTQQVTEEFSNLFSQKTPEEVVLQRRIKNARYIGELAKFKIISPNDVFGVLDTCIDNFSSFTVDVTCHLLETCGKYLYRTSATHTRMSNILGIIWRLKSVKNLEAKHNALIETVYFTIKPPTSTRSRVKAPKSPLHEFIRRLLYRTLTSHNAIQIVRTLSKLNWSDKETQDFVVERIVAVDEMRYSTLDAMANVVLGLARLHEAIGITVVDRLLESIRQGIDRDDAREAQHRIAELALLSALHATGLVPSGIVFEVLYDLVDAGYSSTGWFTVRAICVVLARCGGGWKNGRLSRGGMSMNLESRRKKVFWAVFEKSVFDKKELEGSANYGTFRGRNFSGNLKADQTKTVSSSQSSNPIFDGLEKLTRSTSSGKLLKPEVGVVPLGIQHVLEEAWEAVQEPGLERSTDYESAIKSIAQITESDEKHFLCLPQRSVEVNRNSILASLNLPTEEEDDGEDGEDDDDLEDTDMTLGSVESDFSDEEDAQTSSSDEDDDNLILNTPAKRAKTEEQVEFERELAALTAESVSTARSAAAYSSQNLRRMAIPIGLLAKRGHAVDPPDEDSDREEDLKVVPFQMLVRKGTKSAVKELDVPVGSTIATAARESEVVGAAESAEVRRLVLESRTLVEGEDEVVRNPVRRREQDEREILAALFKPEHRYD